MEKNKEFIRAFLESFSSMIDNAASIARNYGVFVNEINELQEKVRETIGKVEFDIHSSSQYLPDGHSYFKENKLKHLKEHLYICPNYLWCFDELGRNWVKLNRVFARKCDITGVGMYEGYCIQNGLMYIKNLDDLDMHIMNDTDYKSTSDAYNDDYYYYTEWECPLDFQYKLENGKLVDL